MSGRSLLEALSRVTAIAERPPATAAELEEADRLMAGLDDLRRQLAAALWKPDMCAGATDGISDLSATADKPQSS